MTRTNRDSISALWWPEMAVGVDASKWDATIEPCGYAARQASQSL